MNTPHLRTFVPSLVAATTLALAVSAGAQTPAPAAPAPATKAPQAASTTGHAHKAAAAKGTHGADMKKDCEAMMARHHEMQEKMQAMDATLDKLVAEMNAAKESKAVDAMERPMAAVINELVAQRKASRTMMTEMQHGSMTHMSHHMQMHGTKGPMECPMMKKGKENS
jgi:Skp family chaperone for outer membrane proteins